MALLDEEIEFLRNQPMDHEILIIINLISLLHFLFSVTQAVSVLDLTIYQYPQVKHKSFINRERFKRLILIHMTGKYYCLII